MAAKKTTTKKESKTKQKDVVKKAVTKKATAKKAVTKKATAKKTVAKKKTAKKKTLSPRDKAFLGIRKDLIKLKTDLLSEAESAMNALPEPTVFPDLGDQATAETDRNFMLRLRGREHKLLNKIEEAMERIDTNDFGLCNSCGEEISVKRLKARPVASLCIDCKTEQEEDEKLQS